MRKIVIIGAGPTGLGAAYRLKEQGYKNFVIYEKNSYVGGLCATFKDSKGFRWDLGGHVIFSHYKYFDNLLENILGSDYLVHKRYAWIRTMDRWIPYPFQDNLRYLPRDVLAECLRDLKKVKRKKARSANFKEWIIDNMGAGIAKYFMFPYNFKVWAYPINMLSSDWVAERVKSINIEETVVHLISDIGKTDWGPNAIFKFPLFGGTGEIFRRIAVMLDNHIILNSELIKIDPETKKIYFSSGRKESYDVLINTSPLNKLIKLIKISHRDLSKAASDLKHNGVFVVGLGIGGKPYLASKCWVYFPDNTSPFFRVTYFSNYSPNNVPDNNKYYSLLCESAYSDFKKEEKTEIVKKTVQGLINSGVLKKVDKKSIVSTFLFDIDYAYPIPTINRDRILRKIQPELEKMDIYSRGRFGAWKYEIGNTDHSVMQGKEIVDRILRKGTENIWNI
jgi:protoporphyrinogen oxidase